jgi:hypothetical protein
MSRRSHIKRAKVMSGRWNKSGGSKAKFFFKLKKDFQRIGLWERDVVLALRHSADLANAIRGGYPK